jgi:hypothetical protein
VDDNADNKFGHIPDLKVFSDCTRANNNDDDDDKRLLNLNSEESSTYNQPPTTHIQQRHTCKPATAEDIQTLAGTKFQNTDKGLTYKDLLRPGYKRANTAKQAQYILQYHLKRGNIYKIIYHLHASIYR